MGATLRLRGAGRHRGGVEAAWGLQRACICVVGVLGWRGASVGAVLRLFASCVQWRGGCVEVALCLRRGCVEAVWRLLGGGVGAVLRHHKGRLGEALRWREGWVQLHACCAVAVVIYPDFPLDLTAFSRGIISSKF